MLAVWGLLGVVLAGAPKPIADLRFIDTNNIQARQSLEKIAERDPESLPESERMEWVRARLAWIALSRLEGREEDALQIFAGCGLYCEKYGPEQEWQAVRSWGCKRRLQAAPCQKEKTKAQKPPR